MASRAEDSFVEKFVGPVAVSQRSASFNRDLAKRWRHGTDLTLVTRLRITRLRGLWRTRIVSSGPIDRSLTCTGSRTPRRGRHCACPHGAAGRCPTTGSWGSEARPLYPARNRSIRTSLWDRALGQTISRGGLDAHWLTEAWTRAERRTAGGSGSILRSRWLPNTNAIRSNDPG